MEQETEIEKKKLEQRFKYWCNNIQREVSYKYNHNFSYDENKEFFKNYLIQDKYYNGLRTSIKKVCQGYSKILFVQGSPGIGKSKQIRNILEHEQSSYTELSGDITEAYLYRLLHDNNGKIIWCKDLVKIFKTQGMLNLLKAATESEDLCLISKSNYSKQQEDLPDFFYCTCRFIFDFNTINSPSLREDMNALVSRGEFIQLQLSTKQVTELMNTIAVTEKQKEVTNYLIEQINKTPYVDINLRTQYKAFKSLEFCEQNKLDWRKEIIKDLSEYSKNVSIIYSIIGDEQIRTTELKKILLKRGVVNSIRTAHRFIEQMLYVEELIKTSVEDKNFLVKLNIRGSV